MVEINWALVEELGVELDQIGDEIDALKLRIGRQAREAVIEIGKLLIRAQDRLTAAGYPGRWGVWVKERRWGMRTCQNYMRLARNAECEIISHLDPQIGYAEALKLLRESTSEGSGAKPEPKPKLLRAARPSSIVTLAELEASARLQFDEATADDIVARVEAKVEAKVEAATVASEAPADPDTEPEAEAAEPEAAEPEAAEPEAAEPTVEELLNTEAGAMALARRMWDELGPAPCRKLFQALGVLLEETEEAEAMPGQTAASRPRVRVRESVGIN